MRTLKSLMVLLVWSTANAALGQSVENTVSGQGVERVDRPAKFLRLQVDLVAKDKDARKAVAQLKQLKEMAAGKLKELGALADSVNFAEPVLGGPQFATPSAIETAMGMRYSKDESELAKLPPTLMVQLSADWALSADDPIDRLAEAHDLMSRIRKADLGGRHRAKTEEEEEEEEDEPNPAAAAMAAAGVRPSKPGQPKFLFVWKLSPEDRSKATAAAFGRAKTQAEALAVATGARLGRLRSVNAGTITAAGAQSDYWEMYRNMLGGEAQSSTAPDNEAIGHQPGRVEYKVTVNATFELITPKGS